MALMIWDSSLSVGVERIDNEHKKLVQILNDLHTAMTQGQVKAVTGPLLTELVRYTREHFANEEALMLRTKYPQYAEHHAQHKELTSQVEEFVGRYERGEISISVHLLTFLRDWLTTHIQREDRGYGPWMNTHGVQ